MQNIESQELALREKVKANIAECNVAANLISISFIAAVGGCIFLLPFQTEECNETPSYTESMVAFGILGMAVLSSFFNNCCIKAFVEGELRLWEGETETDAAGFVLQDLASEIVEVAQTDEAPAV